MLIPVPAPHGPMLEAYRSRVEASPAPPAHITLVPPTEVDQAEWDAVVDLLRSVSARHGPFRVRLRGTGSFRPVSPVVFVVVVEGISSCEQLEAALRTGPLTRVRRFPYHPHVTIAHGVPDAVLDQASADQADFSASFDVSSFALFRSDGHELRLVCEFDLVGG